MGVFGGFAPPFFPNCPPNPKAIFGPQTQKKSKAPFSKAPIKSKMGPPPNQNGKNPPFFPFEIPLFWKNGGPPPSANFKKFFFRVQIIFPPHFPFFPPTLTAPPPWNSFLKSPFFKIFSLFGVFFSWLFPLPSFFGAPRQKMQTGVFFLGLPSKTLKTSPIKNEKNEKGQKKHLQKIIKMPPKLWGGPAHFSKR